MMFVLGAMILGHRYRILALLFFVLPLLGGGCTARPPVSIPAEWHTTAKPPLTAPTRPSRIGAAEPSPTQPVLQPLPSIQEEDLGAVPSRDVNVGIRPYEGAAANVVKPVAPATENPQHLASMHLVNTAKTALLQGKAEQAIAQLEQAIQVDAYNAEAFLILAEAWKTKGDRKRALEFARKAEVLYQDKPKELKRVYLLEADLLKASGQAREAEKYRQMAARLEM
jgi:tetratricopeptide (TPR) repeat protein